MDIAIALEHDLQKKAHRGIGAVDFLVNIIVRYRDQAGVFERHRRGRARQAIDDRHLAEQIPLGQGCDHELAIVFLHRNLDDAGFDNVSAVSAVSFPEDELARGKLRLELI